MIVVVKLKGKSLVHVIVLRFFEKMGRCGRMLERGWRCTPRFVITVSCKIIPDILFINSKLRASRDADFQNDL